MKKLSLIFIPLVFLAMISIPGLLHASDPLKVGSPAPALTLMDQDGQPFDLATAYAKGTVLVYFYPKANTPGCTAQACSLRDDIENLGDLGIQVVGVSRDTPGAQKKFQEQHHLPFTLLADEKGELASAFGVGSVLGFSNRSSFLVEGGKIAWLTPSAKTSGHAAEVQDALKALGETNP